MCPPDFPWFENNCQSDGDRRRHLLLGGLDKAVKDGKIGGEVGKLGEAGKKGMNNVAEGVNNVADALQAAYETTENNFGVSAVLLQQSIALDSDTSRRTILFDPQTHTT